jgi:hypothetical protein
MATRIARSTTQHQTKQRGLSITVLHTLSFVMTTLRFIMVFTVVELSGENVRSSNRGA